MPLLLLCLVVDGQRVEKAEAGTDVQVIVNQTPFYGESGGQVGDSGVMFTAEGAEVPVSDTQKKLGALWVHQAKVAKGAISVGDVVDVGGGHSGLVEAITIRTIKLRDQAGGVHSIPFSQVNSVLNLTKDFSYYVMDIGIGYGEDTDRVIGVIKDLGAELQATPQFGRLILEPIEILGVDAFRENAVIIKARIKTRPIQQWTVGREFNRRMKRRFDELGIEIPFPQRTIHIRNDGQPPVAAELPAPAGSPPQALRAGRGG